MNVDQIAEGAALVERALRSHGVGPYSLQAAIAAIHAEARSAGATDRARSSDSTTSCNAPIRRLSSN